MHLAASKSRPRILLLVAALLTSASSVAEPGKATLAGDWQVGRAIATGRAETLRLSAGTSLRLGANTELEVQPKIALPSGTEGLMPQALSAQLTRGRVDINIDPKKRPAYGVMLRGPRRTSVLARAGHVAVAASPAGVAVGVYDGKDASVGIGSSWKLVAPGNVVVVSPKAPLGIESKLLPAPTKVAVTRPAVALDGITEPTRAVWDAVPGAQRYFVHLVNTNSNVAHRIESREPSAPLTGLSAGKYALRVSAGDEFGIDGSPSEPLYVSVVGIELPPGAFVAQHKLYLEPLQQVVLSNVEGLEATYDSASVYFKASDRVGLRGTQATTLHLRVPGSSERTSIELVPRALRTAVEILPAAARWPRDKVVVRIELPNQGADAPPIEVIPTVTVNSQPVSVGWVRSTQGLEAVIPAPPVYPGPWVLRAVVADQHGIVLGRNFLEIASMADLDDQDIPREIHRGSPP